MRFLFPFVHSQAIDKELFIENAYGISSGLRPDASGKAFGKEVNIDAFGFRVDAKAYKKGDKTWLLLGDSVTFGVGVKDDETFASILDDHISYANIINPSVPGYTCEDYRNVLNGLLEENQFDIDQVILCYCLNDVYAKKSSDLQNQREGWLKSTASFMRSNSMLYNWLKGLVANRPKAYYEYDASFYAEGNEDYEKALEILADCNELCNESGIGFSVMPLPYSHQYQLDSDIYGVQDKIIADLESINVHCLDHPGEAIQSDFPRHPKKAFLFGDGIHFSIGGHIAVANHLIKELSISSLE